VVAGDQVRMNGRKLNGNAVALSWSCQRGLDTADGRRLVLIRTGRGQHYFGWDWNQNTAAIVVPVAQ
jgi:hypothetical protein